ncbi:MAG: tRNA-dihydrouridine synthase [Candidatus Gottesmanbacteria bacterium]|nr:tRNA-dihydrouridine synthase [Candidatus Gottesmanbacteria bacterium]
MKSFWQDSSRPILALAPMEDVTDTVFRRIVAMCARPTVFFTEFTSVDGLFSRGREAIIHRFDYTEIERPIIAQIWGNSPELFYKAAKLIAEMKFDGVDINAGCPEKNVTSHGGGACLIQDPPRVAEIIQATKEGARRAEPSGRRLPVSVKTRLGYKKISDDWIRFLLEQNIDALTVHGRTVAELSKVPAHWDEIAKAVKLRTDMKKNTVIIGNGDVADYADVVAFCREFGTDGAMIGRGIFHNLWAFDKNGISHMDDHKELLRIMRKHMQLFEKTGKNFAILKKFFKIYVQGFPHASEIRERLMEANSPREAEAILGDIMT